MTHLALDALFVYQILITVVIVGLLWVTLLNLLQFRRLPAKGSVDRATAPRVSILIPARNEERCVKACVESLCQQDYPDYEVIVLDDGSTDATPDILRGLQTRFSHLRVLQGTELPSGWVGKSWACHQLSQQATGEYLLFTDADTIHGPASVGAAVTLAQRDRLDFFSLIPYEELGSFGEHAVIPMVHMLYFSYLPNQLIVNDPRTSLCAANGQFMFFRRDAYNAVGGHTAVHNALVEDVFLAKVMKGAGKRIALVDGVNHVWCRMYTSAREVTRGFSKNFFPGTGYNLPVTIAFLAHLFTAYVSPVLFAIAGFVYLRSTPEAFSDLTFTMAWLALPLTHIIIAGIIRLLIALRFRMPWWHMFIHPITAAWAMGIGINSIRWAYSRHGAEWKGRSYSQVRS